MNELQIIKKTIQEIVGDDLSRVILFGSRARGDNRPDSDYDLLITIRRSFSRAEKTNWSSRVHKKLSELDLFVDLLWKTEEKFELHSQLAGLVSYSVAREGVKL